MQIGTVTMDLTYTDKEGTKYTVPVVRTLNLPPMTVLVVDVDDEIGANNCSIGNCSLLSVVVTKVTGAVNRS